MECIINGQKFRYIQDALNDKFERAAYFLLVQKIFGLDFERWHQSEYWDNRFIPYVIMDGDIAVASVAVCVNDLRWQDKHKRYVQISTVMTLHAYRGKGLNRYLMETILTEWKEKCDAIYLLANDSVVNLYPKFGFEKFMEFQHSKPVSSTIGVYRKLDIKNQNDWLLIMEKYMLGNPFSRIKVENRNLFAFHCVQNYSDDIYFVDKYNAVVIFQCENEVLNCYDIFSDEIFEIDELLNLIANENTKIASLGFTPKSDHHYIVKMLQEVNTHLFVLEGKDNIYKNKRIMLPVLSRA